MKKKIIEFGQKHPVKLYWIIAVLLAILVAPIAIFVFMSFPDFGKEIFSFFLKFLKRRQHELSLKLNNFKTGWQF